MLASAQWDVCLLQECPPRWADRLADECLASAYRSAHLAQLALAPARRGGRFNPDLMGSWEGGSNVILARPPWQIVEGASILLNPLRERRLRERRRMALARLVDNYREVCVANLHLSAGLAQAVRARGTPGGRDRARVGAGRAARAGGRLQPAARMPIRCSTSFARARSCAGRRTPTRSINPARTGMETVRAARAVGASPPGAGRAHGPRAPAAAAVRPRAGRGALPLAIACRRRWRGPAPQRAAARERATTARERRSARRERLSRGIRHRQGGLGARPDRPQRARAAERGAADPQAHRGGRSTTRSAAGA